MKKMPHIAQCVSLGQIPNIGPETKADLKILGITLPVQLVGRDPLSMYKELNQITGVVHDLCVIDVFMAITDFANGAAAKPWHYYTKIRKRS
jgi:hypothetical protein